MSQSLQQILIFGYVQQFQQIHTLPANLPIEIVHIIYLFYNKKRMISEWLSDELIQYSKHRKIKQGIHFKTGAISLLTEITPINSKISDSKTRQILREFNIIKQINHKNIMQVIDVNINANKYDTHGHKTKCILYIFNHKHFCLLFDIICFIRHLNERASHTYFQQLINALSHIYDFGIVPHSIAHKHLFLDRNFTLKLMIQTEYFNFEMDTNTKKHTYPLPRSSNIKNGKTVKFRASTNIFGLGILLFAMYAGFPPFQSVTDSDWWWDKLSKGWKYLVASEKQKYQKDRDKYVAVSTRKIQLFWRAHQRTRRFSDKIKNIIVHLLHPYSEYRYQISNIRTHEWYTETDSYDSKELGKYMKECITNARKELHKGLDLSNGSGNGNGREYSLRGTELDPFNEFESNITTIARDYGTYQFQTQIKPCEIAARLEKIMDRNGSTLTVCCADACVLIRCVTDTNGEDIIILCKQYRIENEKGYIVKFSRVKGSLHGFHVSVEHIFKSDEMVSAMMLAL